ncbi:MAG: hypothetical protein EKK64_04995 [Neisseriaceae bacterium]|nr:MAG: hypothetical protein EKK64_04995 [Neisseriaceae bacterium]
MSANLTSKNSVITFKPKNSPSITFKSYATDSMMGIDDVENVVSKVGIDGYIARYMKSVLLTGTFKFIASSPTVSEIDKLLEVQTEQSTPISGVLTVVIPATGKTYVYDDLCFLSAPKGRELDEAIKDVTYKWDSGMPNIQTNTSGINSIIDNVKNGLSALSDVASAAEKINRIFK